ncbi:hypothetical protein [Janthinobacterium sp.]|uniref:hypothetical protein n=1 Tax=Janthinobacterium sp. TaxID=1871054 RepID=UPI00260642C3|nr:hypothetical protein [Janthinobacterium sp.]
MATSLESVGRQTSYAHGQNRALAGPQEGWLFELETAMLAQGVKKNAQDAMPDTNEHVSEPVAQKMASQKTMELIDPLAKTVLAGAAETKDLSGAYAFAALEGMGDIAMAPASAAIMYGLQRGGVQAATVAATAPTYSGNAEVPPVGTVMLTMNPGAGTATIQSAEQHQEAEAVASQAMPTVPENVHDQSLRKIHFYYDAEGVHAWIRDTALSVAQGAMVAHAMEHELRAAGARLAAVTVNGKELKITQKAPYGGDFFAEEPAFPAVAVNQLITKDAI